jgi:DNA polymerase III subunit alpha
MNFASLHMHSTYSIRDAISQIPNLLEHANNLGYKNLALTDHGTASGLLSFYKECNKYDIKPILGIEAYVANRSRFDKDSQLDKYYHLTLLVMNEIGWQNLCRLIEESYKREHFYHRPRIDRELLKKHNEGLICLSGCMGVTFIGFDYQGSD